MQNSILERSNKKKLSIFNNDHIGMYFSIECAHIITNEFFPSQIKPFEKKERPPKTLEIQNNTYVAPILPKSAMGYNEYDN